jgi:hypothetical protein
MDDRLADRLHVSAVLSRDSSRVQLAEPDPRLLEPAPIAWLGGELGPGAKRTLQAAVDLVGARLVPMQDAANPHALIGTFDGLGAVSPAVLESVRTGLTSAPLLLFPGRPGDTPSGQSLAALRRLAGDEELSFVDGSTEVECTFGDVRMMHPFAGQVLHEQTPRLVASLVPSRAALPLASNPRGMTFARYRKRLFLSVVPPADANSGPLQEEFHSARFLGLLPLLLFLREALASAAWTSMAPRATFMIDDPNFRFTRYGFIKYRSLIEASKKHEFHTTIAMIPIDWKKTAPRVASMIHDNQDRLSIVVHGVDHLSEEFAARVPLGHAEATLAQGLARMTAHERDTGLRFARAITFPHDACNTVWMRAMRNAGLEAAIARRGRPVDLDPAADDPLFGLHPAEMSVLGFPVIHRFRAEHPREELLFKAFLGKPLVVYTHHGFLCGDVDAFVHVAEYVNNHVAPRWSGIDAIVRSNYQLRESPAGLAARVFSNRVHAQTGTEHHVKVVLKPTLQAPSDELCWVNGQVAAPSVAPGAGLALAVPASPQLEIVFGPQNPIAVPGTPGRPRLRSRSRRLATELRDQVVQPLFRIARSPAA